VTILQEDEFIAMLDTAAAAIRKAREKANGGAGGSSGGTSATTEPTPSTTGGHLSDSISLTSSRDL
jgi:hypothetical protein